MTVIMLVKIVGAGDQLTESRHLIENKEYQKAIQILKPQIKTNPNSREAVLLLAKAYLGKKNRIWALKTIASYLRTHPDDYEAIYWKGWIETEQGNFEKALKTVKNFKSIPQIVIQNRYHLLTALVDTYNNEKASAAGRLCHIRANPQLFEEDQFLYRFITEDVEPAWRSPLSLKLTTRLGYDDGVLNALPEEPEAKITGSPAYGIKFDLIAEPYLSPIVRPYLSGRIEQDHYSNHGTEFGTLSTKYEIKSNLRLTPFWLKTGYHGGAYQINFSPKDFLKNSENHSETWLYQYHRIEFDLRYQKWIIFGGGGKRKFRYGLKSRTETDVGCIVDLFQNHNLSLRSLFSIYHHAAENNSYDLQGVNFLLPFDYQINDQYTLLFDLFLYYDNYPKYPLKERKDLAYEAKTALLFYLNSEISFGLSYAYENLTSNVDTENFENHQVELKMTFQQKWFEKKFQTKKPKQHVTIPYHLDDHRKWTRYDQMRDLIYRRESMRKQSSCIN